MYPKKPGDITHHSGLVGGGVVVVTNYNLGNNFKSIVANFMKLPNVFFKYHKGYNLTKGHNYARLFDKIIPPY